MIKDSVYIQGLIDYIKDVKPYSSKLVDVAVEYLFSDSLNVSVTDKHAIQAKIASTWITEFSYDGKTTSYQLPVSSVGDRLYISFGNYNVIGIASPNTIGAILDNKTTFVPYKRDVPEGANSNPGDGSNSNFFNGFGGSFNVDSGAPEFIPGGATDPTDYTNGLPNWDVATLDGGEIPGSLTVNFIDATTTITGFTTDSYGYTRPSTAIVPGRNGALIGSLVRSVLPGGNAQYIFEFNKGYLDDFIPIGTFVKLVVSQRDGMAGHASVNISEKFRVATHEAMDDGVVIKNTNKEFIGAYDIGGYDTYGYDVRDNTVLSEEESTVGDQMSSTTMFEELSVKMLPIVGNEVIETVSISMPGAQVDDFYTHEIVGVKHLMINHFMGEKNEDGDFRFTGGVSVEVIGATPVSVTNPYLNNLPPLFTTTEIIFAEPTTATIKLTVVKTAYTPPTEGGGDFAGMFFDNPNNSGYLAAVM